MLPSAMQNLKTLMLDPHAGLGIGVKAGFALLLLLLAGVTLVGITRMAEINRQLDHLVARNLVKQELAFSVNAALRDRLVGMHLMAAMTDDFDREAESHRVRDYGLAFREYRERLAVLATTAQEKALLAKIQEHAISARPITEKIMEQTLSGQIDAARLAIRTEAMPAQGRIVQAVNEFIELQKHTTHAGIADATASYANARLLMLIFGSTATLLGFVIAIIVVRLTNRQAESLKHQAMFDGLTDLPNRTLFADRLQQAILVARREHQCFALIALDLNRFKEINDTLGHHAGDLVLQHVAIRIRACLRESDTIARVGGDEFVILLTTVNDVDGAVIAANKILKALSQAPAFGKQQIDVGASLGIAMFPEHAEDAEALKRRADAAMYHAKRAGSGYAVYSDVLGQGFDDRGALQSELRHALAHDELLLHYQPKIDFKSGCVNGVEVLVRWPHPQHGLLMPDKFIPLAETSGLMKQLTCVVLRGALRQCEEWRRAGINLSVLVNLSAVNIRDPAFPDKVAGILAEFSVPPAQLELEVTEAAIMSEPAVAMQCIKQLSMMGLQISIDDFGTGYSSMVYLKELLIAKIKIDRSFVKNMASNHNDAVSVRSTVELGHNLGLKVVAEGVETQEVWDCLHALGCDDAQGYFMSRPLPASDLTSWLNNSPWGVVQTRKDIQENR